LPQARHYLVLPNKRRYPRRCWRSSPRASGSLCTEPVRQSAISGCAKWWLRNRRQRNPPRRMQARKSSRAPTRQGRPDPDRTAVTNEGGSEPTKARQRRPRSRVAPTPCEPSSTPTAEALSRAGWTHRERRSTRTGSSDHYRLFNSSEGGKIPDREGLKTSRLLAPFLRIEAPVVFDGARRGAD
jgi:hypothetical protein